MTRSGHTVLGLAAVLLSACKPAAIPVNGDLPANEAATLREVENLGGWVEITRVDQNPLPEGAAYAVSAGKHKIELVRQSPTSGSSAETYFVKGGHEYAAWDGCVKDIDPKTGDQRQEKDQKTGELKDMLRCENPQLLPAEALSCYQRNERTSDDCKELTETWNESSGNE